MVQDTWHKVKEIKQVLQSEGYNTSGKVSFLSVSVLSRFPCLLNVSRNTAELTITVFLALIFASIHNSSPILASVTAVGIIAAIPILLYAKLHYAIFFLAAILPFRDIHFVSIIHLKRFVIWSFFLYIILRQFTTTQQVSSRNLSLFNKSVAVFMTMLGISLLKTFSVLHSNSYLTIAMFKSSFFSGTLVVIEELLLFYIVYYSIKTFRQLQRLIDVMVAASVIISLLGIFQYYQEGPPGIIHFLFDPDYQFYGRATSVFSNPNRFGEFLSPIVGISIVTFGWGTISRVKKFLFFLPAIILNCWGIYLSSSRGAMLQVLFSFIVMGYIYYTKICHKKLSWKVFFLTIFIIGFMFSAIQYYELYLQARLRSKRTQDYQTKLLLIKTRNDITRKRAAIGAIQTFIKHPILGVGQNLLAGNVRTMDGYFGLPAHNQYLTILAEMGLLGFIPFILMFGIVLKTGMKFWDKSLKSQPAPESQAMMLLLLTGTCTTMFGYLFADTLAVFPITGYLWILSGAIFMLERQNLESHS